MSGDVYVSGIGMVPFQKPGKENFVSMVGNAVRAALADAGLDYGQIQQAYTGYVYGDSPCGHRAIYEVGMTGIPVFNVNSNCSTGSSRLVPGAPGRRGAARRIACWSSGSNR